MEGIQYSLQFRIFRHKEGDGSDNQSNGGESSGNPSSELDHSAKNQFVVLVGVPGSGKSTLVKERFLYYMRVNLDTLKTRRREDMAILFALERGENIVIDNTNTTRRSRKKYINMARARQIPITGIYLECPLELALKRNSSREGKERVPDSIVKFYYRILEPPSREEGFDSVEVVRMLPDS